MAPGRRKKAVHARLRNLGIEHTGAKRNNAREVPTSYLSPQFMSLTHPFDTVLAPPRLTKPAEAAIKKAAKARARMEQTFAEIIKPTWGEQLSTPDQHVSDTAPVPVDPMPASPLRDPEACAMVMDGMTRAAVQTQSG